MTTPSVRFLPESGPGKWTVGLISSVPILFMIGFSLTDTLYRSIPAGESILKDISARPVLALSMLAGMAAGVSSLITGLVAVIKSQDHGILVYLATLIGGLLTIYLAAELAFPH